MINIVMTMQAKIEKLICKCIILNAAFSKIIFSGVIWFFCVREPKWVQDYCFDFLMLSEINLKNEIKC